MSRLAYLWRRPEHPTPSGLRAVALFAGFAAAAIATLAGGKPLMLIVVPAVTVCATELWWQPRRAAQAAARASAEMALRAPDPHRPRDPLKDPASYRGRRPLLGPELAVRRRRAGRG
jgi:hypothetical protein